MGRQSRNELLKYVEQHSVSGFYYYKNPSMTRKANLGRDRLTAVRMAKVLNTKYRIQVEQRATRLEAAVDLGSPRFDAALESFVEKYIADYRLKSSTAALLKQRQNRLAKQIGDVQVANIDTQMLREVLSCSSHFEQTKMRTLLMRFFRYAKSYGAYPSHLVNPVDDLFVDPVPRKQRHRMTIRQLRAMYAAAPEWLQWLMTLAFHLALRRVDLVNLRF